MTKIYGIKNCDTMKKALKWLDTQGFPYDLIDYKKEVADKSILQSAMATHGWEKVLNRRGTTWRKLPDDVKESMNEKNAIDLAIENPSIIKRPLLIHDDEIHLGFKDDQYQEIFK